MLLACKVAVRVTERARTAYLSMLVMCLCIRLIFVKINSYIYVNKKEKHLASPYVYVNLMQQGCQIKLFIHHTIYCSATDIASSGV